MITWILVGICALLLVVIGLLIYNKIDAKKTMVGAVVAALGIGASTGQLPDIGPKFIVENGVTTKTVYAEIKDQGKNRPEHDIIIRKPLETGRTMTMAIWYDTVLVGDLVYKKTIECDSGKVTNVWIGIIVGDTVGVK